MVIILKLGGSIITDKSKPMKIRYNVIERIAKEVREFINKNEDKLVIIHGGGSIGHYLVCKLRVKEEGWPPLKYSIIAHEMLKLSSIIANAFIKEGIPSIVIPPHAIFSLGENLVIKYDAQTINIIKEYLDRNIIPILYGDAVIYEKGSTKFEILSGDDIAWLLASILGARKLLFATSVDGVYDKHPKEKDAKLIRELNLCSIKFDEKTVGSKNDGKYYDVTGGMMNKLKAGMKYINSLKDTEILIFNGLIEGNIYKALIDKPIRYTQVKIKFE